MKESDREDLASSSGIRGHELGVSSQWHLVKRLHRLSHYRIKNILTTDRH